MVLGESGPALHSKWGRWSLAWAHLPIDRQGGGLCNVTFETLVGPSAPRYRHPCLTTSPKRCQQQASDDVAGQEEASALGSRREASLEIWQSQPGPAASAANVLSQQPLRR